jgi:alkylation response protein AidB-like acyl-CoA dehydrogenase
VATHIQPLDKEALAWQAPTQGTLVVVDGIVGAGGDRKSVLSDDLLAGCAARSPAYDRENRFFDEDFEALRDASYLTIAVPQELGGGGYSLAQVCREQRRLAYFAAPTALAINMHLYWTGLVADLWRRGDRSLQWLLEEAANGAVFAAGHAESGNDIPVLLSTTRAERVDGGYRFSGHKAFGSLTPVSGPTSACMGWT